MTMSSRNGQLIARVRSAGSGVARIAKPYTRGAAVNGLHHGFAMTGCDTNVWPLSPKDWSTG
jgi:hypothetical protein